MTTRIFVTVGTDHHPFTRLIDWVDDWASGRNDIALTVQHGSSRPSRTGTNHELLDADEIAAEYAKADLVISQVGPGTIADANGAGHRPIVVPRDPSLGEVVDDHQVAFGQFMDARGRCVCLHTEEQLIAEVEKRMTSTGLPPLSGAELPSSTAAELSVITQQVVTSPRQRFSVRRLMTVLRSPRPPITSTS